MSAWAVTTRPDPLTRVCRFGGEVGMRTRPDPEIRILGISRPVTHPRASLGGTPTPSIPARRLIGPERTLFYSAVGVMLGHIALAVLPGLAGVGVGLVLIALGSGGVKALVEIFGRETPVELSFSQIQKV